MCTSTEWLYEAEVAEGKFFLKGLAPAAGPAGGRDSEEGETAPVPARHCQSVTVANGNFKWPTSGSCQWKIFSSWPAANWATMGTTKIKCSASGTVTATVTMNHGSLGSI